MRIKASFASNMYNWAITPSICVWRGQGNSGIAIHFMRVRIALYRTPWERILWDLFHMQIDIAHAKRHTPGTGPMR